MDVLLLGASHKTASVDERGRLANAVGESPGWFQREGPSAGIAEMFILATCHRVEVLALVADLDRAERALIRGFFRGAGDRSSSLYTHRGSAAVEHLARVACGLESLIVGEAEISGQIRRAAAAGRETGMLGARLARIIAGALGASGHARAATRIGAGTVSAAGAAVSILERAWGTLAGRSVLVIGAGEAGRQALHRLRRRGAARLFVASRSRHHAQEAAARHDATVIELTEVARELCRLDGVVAAARATERVVDAAMCVARGDFRDFQIVDLSMPRVVDPAVAELAGVTLHTVDDLGDVVRASLERRVREMPRAADIVASEAARAYATFVAACRDRRRSAVA